MPPPARPNLAVWIESDYEGGLVLLLSNEGGEPAFNTNIEWTEEPKPCSPKPAARRFGTLPVLAQGRLDKLHLGQREDFLRLNGGRTTFGGTLMYKTAAGNYLRRPIRCRVLPERPRTPRAAPAKREPIRKRLKAQDKPSTTP